MAPFPPEATCVLPMNAKEYYAIQNQPSFRSLFASVSRTSPPHTNDSMSSNLKSMQLPVSFRCAALAFALLSNLQMHSMCMKIWGA